MRIGMVVEGSYPFVSGGVASWVQTMVRHFSEHEFVIYAIVTHKDPSMTMKYTLPENIERLEIIPLHKDVKPIYPSKKLTDEEVEIVSNWFAFKQSGKEALQILQEQDKVGNTEAFLNSTIFYDIVKKCYVEEQITASFLDYLWMFRSMYQAVIQVLQADTAEADVIHTVSTGYGGLLGSVLSIRFDCPLVLTEHGLYTREREEEILKADWIPSIYKNRWIRFFKKLANEAYDRAHVIISLFDRNSRLQEEAGAPSEKLMVIPNGVEMDAYAGLRPVETKIREEIIFTSVLRVVPIKDVKTMIYAAKIIKEKEIPFLFYLVGPTTEEPEYAEECRELIERLQLQDNIVMTGQADVKAYLKKTDVLVLTSVSEGQPLAMLEGMAAGIPWIVTDVGSCRELVAGAAEDELGRCGFYVPAVAPDAVAFQMEWFYNNQDHIQDMGLIGQKRIEVYYQLQHVITQYRTVYHSLKREEESDGRHRVSSSEVI
ncbi:GT4 family glycosyltransferase PelF [Domibacillus iocasae]|uniref:Glycoside hydrolase n=1 Tax=Domibacillus iocasae TaxID=1714016 RepID=A0A1E7DNA7_9BACI|nr:GT4 family glycosyltransferase PelF [Domibacillus iocasae]OES44566.1 glycoside hydrolase [Domibacillus iocasae]